MSSTDEHNYWQVADLIPHQPPMQLLDRILAADDEGLWACASPARSLSSCWGIEFLGQATAAFFTLRGLSQCAQQEPTPGMLIGSRSYHAHHAMLAAKRTLVMEVGPISKLQGNSGMVKFKGKLWLAEDAAFQQLALSTSASRLPYDSASCESLAGELMIEGDLSVYIPPPDPTATPS